MEIASDNFLEGDNPAVIVSNQRQQSLKSMPLPVVANRFKYRGYKDLSESDVNGLEKHVQ